MRKAEDIFEEKKRIIARLFDELGLKSYNPNGEGKLLTHVVFHPVQKSLNRLLQVDYTIRVQSLTGFTEV